MHENKIKKKLIYLSSALLPSKTANSIQVVRMCSALSEYFEEAYLIARRSKECKTTAEVLNYYSPKNTFKILYTTLSGENARLANVLPQFVKILFRFNKKESIVYARDVYGAMVAALLGFDFFYESHGFPSRKYIMYMEQFLIKNSGCKRFVVISDGLKKRYNKIFNQKQMDRVLILHDGADLADGKSYKSEQKNFTAVYIGHLYKGRGIDIIVEVAKKLKDVEFLIVGGNDEDIIYWKKLSSENLKFIGHVPPNKTSKYREQADVLLMPYQEKVSVSGGGDTSAWMSPMKLFEYMSSGKAIISSDLPVLREVLNESNSILVCASSVSEWVDAINLLITNNELGDKLGSKAKLDFLSKYTWKSRAKKIFEILQQNSI